MGFFDFLKSEQKWADHNEAYDVRDVADCIIAQPCCRDITNKELCCILYWTQADFLVVLGRRCFDSQIKAYHNRLSIRELTENLTWFGNKRNIAPQDEPRIIEIVYEAKNNYSSGDEMMQAIRKQKPYLQAILNGSFVIDETDLKEYFDKWGTKEEYDRQVKIPKESALETALYRLNINISPIKDGDFKSKLCRMYDAINNVLIATEENPTKEKGARRLTEYYIPTMIKLLGKYSRLSESGRKTPEVEKTIKDIEALPDEIIKVANAVYDDIMEENLIDINADISVLKQKAESDKGSNDFKKTTTNIKEYVFTTVSEAASMPIDENFDCIAVIEDTKHILKREKGSKAWKLVRQYSPEVDEPDYKKFKQVNLHVCLFKWKMNEIKPDETKEEYAFLADVQEYWWFDFKNNWWHECSKEDVDDLRMNKFWRMKVC